MQQKTLLNSLKAKLNSQQSDVIIAIFVVIILLLFVYHDIIIGCYFIGISLCLKMSGLSICVVYAIIKKWSNGNCDNKILCAAMLMTALGDYMLTMNAYYSLGIICFGVVHMLYIIRHWRYLLSKQKRVVSVLACTMTVVVSGGIFFVQPVLNKIAIVYGLILSLSLLTASMLLYISDKSRKHVTIFYGILLFFLCDACVAIFNVTSGYFSEISGLLIWIWYLPAQLCLVLSGDRYRHNKGEN